MCWTCLRPHVCCFLDTLDGEKSPIPIGSMVLLYMVLHGSHQYTPFIRGVPKSQTGAVIV